MTPALAREDWAPAVAFVHRGRCALSLSFALGSPELAAFSPRVWLAGKPGENLALHWESWSATSGWQAAGPDSVALPSSRSIAPEAAASAVTEALALPFSDRVGQLLFYAERTYTRASDGAPLTVRSNPLLISLYAG